MLREENYYITATFIERLNRFVASVLLENKKIKVYVPNTGKLSELLIPGREVLLVPSPGKYPYKLMYVFYNNYPVLVDSIFSNKIFYKLIEEKRVPGFEDYSVLRREPAFHNSRFDLLVEDTKGNQSFIELKSCTLAWGERAAFPDAVSSRAVEHMKQLAKSGMGKVVFLIFHPGVKFFFPNYHTDFVFYETLKHYQHDIDIYAYSVIYQDFSVKSLQKVRVVIPEKRPIGSYLIVFYNDTARHIDVGKGGFVFEKGYYVYSGSGMKNVFKRIEHHKRRQKYQHWHIDYIKPHMKFIRDIPIVTEKNIECLLAHSMHELGGEPVPGFGSSDCSCASHFHYFEKNPLHSEGFWQIILSLRFA